MTEMTTEMTINEKERIQTKFIASLSKLSTKPKSILSDLPDYDESKENRRFAIFCIVMVAIILFCGISIITGDPFYRRASGQISEFFLTFAIHSIIMVGILKTIRQDESILKHIFVGTLSVLVLGIAVMACRFLFVPGRLMVWAIIPLLTKFKFQEGFSPLLIALGFILPVGLQFSTLALLYKFDRLSLIAPYLAYLLTTIGITGLMMLSPLIGGM
jgi:hypothetical protein